MSLKQKVIIQAETTELEKKLQAATDLVNKTQKELFQYQGEAISLENNLKKARKAQSEELANLEKQIKEYRDSINGETASLVKNGKTQKEREAELKRLEKQYRETKKAHSLANAELIREKTNAQSTIRAQKLRIEQQKSLISSSEQQAKSTKKASSETKNFTNDIVRHLRQIETLVVAYYALTRGWENTIGVGIRVNRLIEDNTSGIAALLSANTSMVLSNGQVVTSYEKFAMGQKVAAQTLQDLKKASVDTYATFPQLTELFQQAIGQTLSMGDAFGSTVEEINKNTIKLTQRISNISGAIGQPMDRAREEIRSLLSANASTDSLIATMLFGSPGEANKAVREARAKGKGAMTALMNDMLGSFDVLADVDSYTKNLLKLQDAYESLMKSATEPLFEDLAEGFAELAKLINENSDDITESIENIYRTLMTANVPFGILNEGLETTIELFKFFGQSYDETMKILGTDERLNIFTNAMLGLSVAIETVYAGFNNFAAVAGGFSIKNPKDQSFWDMIKSGGLSFDTKAVNKEIVTIDQILEKYEEAYNKIIDIRDKSIKKQQDLAKGMGGELQTKTPFDKKILEEAFKTIEKGKPKLEALNDSITKNAEELAKYQKLIADYSGVRETVKLAESQKAIDKEIAVNKIKASVIQKAINEQVKQYNEEELKQLLEKLKLNHGLEVSQKKLAGMGVTDLELAQFETKLAKIRLDAVDDEVASHKQKTEAQKEYNKALAKEQGIRDDIEWAKAVEEFEKFDPDFDEVEKKTKGLGEYFGQQLAENATGALQSMLDGDFDFKQFSSNFSKEIGQALASQQISNMAQNVSGGWDAIAQKTDWVSMIIGVILMAVGSELGKGKEAEQSFAEQMRAQTEAIVDALEKQTQILSNFGNNLDALETSLAATTAEFTGQIGLFGAWIEGFAISWNTDALFNMFKTPYDEKVNIRLQYVEEVKNTESLINFLEDVEGYWSDIGIEFDMFKNLPSWFVSAQREYINGLLDVRNTYNDLSDSLKDVYDSINGNYYANQELIKAQNDVNKLIGNKDFSQYLKDVITGLDQFDTTIDSLKNRLISTDIETQLKALAELEKITGKTFQDNTAEALDYLDSIELVGEAMVRQKENTYGQLQFIDELKGSQKALEFAKKEVGSLADELPTTIDGLISLRQAFLDNDGVIDTYEQAIIDATLATDPFVEAIEEIAMTLSDATNIVGDSIANSVSAIQTLLSAGRDMTTAALVSEGDSASLMNQFRENLSKTLSSAKAGDVKASTYAQETVSSAQAYIQMLEETGASSRDIGFGKARIAQELSLVEGGEIETTLSDILNTSIDYLGETSPIVEWLKTINGSVSDMTFQEYETQKKNEEAYNIVAEELGLPVPFAEGGIVTKPTLGLIGEAGYNEAVIPLKNPNDPLNSNAIISNLEAQNNHLVQQNELLRDIITELKDSKNIQDESLGTLQELAEGA